MGQFEAFLAFDTEARLPLAQDLRESRVKLKLIAHLDRRRVKALLLAYTQCLSSWRCEREGGCAFLCLILLLEVIRYSKLGLHLGQLIGGVPALKDPLSRGTSKRCLFV